MDVEQYRPRDRAYDPEPIQDVTSKGTRIIAVLAVLGCIVGGGLLLLGNEQRTASVAEMDATSASSTMETSASQVDFRAAGTAGVATGGLDAFRGVRNTQ